MHRNLAYTIVVLLGLAIFATLIGRDVLPTESFLSHFQSDVIALLGILGFGLALWQMYKTASASRAATKAAIEALDASRQQYNKYVVNHAQRICSESRLFVQHEEWTAAALRLQDLAELITQIADTDTEWKDLALRLREMQQQFNRVGKGDKKFQPLQTKWAQLDQSVVQKLSTYCGPFARFDQVSNDDN